VGGGGGRRRGGGRGGGWGGGRGLGRAAAARLGWTRREADGIASPASSTPWALIGLVSTLPYALASAWQEQRGAGVCWVVRASSGRRGHSRARLLCGRARRMKEREPCGTRTDAGKNLQGPCVCRRQRNRQARAGTRAGTRARTVWFSCAFCVLCVCARVWQIRGWCRCCESSCIGTLVRCSRKARSGPSIV